MTPKPKTRAPKSVTKVTDPHAEERKLHHLLLRVEVALPDGSWAHLFSRPDRAHLTLALDKGVAAKIGDVPRRYREVTPAQ